MYQTLCVIIVDAMMYIGSHVRDESLSANHDNGFETLEVYRAIQ